MCSNNLTLRINLKDGTNIEVPLTGLELIPAGGTFLYRLSVLNEYNLTDIIDKVDCIFRFDVLYNETIKFSKFVEEGYNQLLMAVNKKTDSYTTYEIQIINM